MKEAVIGGHYRYRMEPQLSHWVVMAILAHRHHTQFSSESHGHHYVGLDLALPFCSVGSSPAQPHYHHHLFLRFPRHQIPWRPCPRTASRQLGLCGQ